VPLELEEMEEYTAANIEATLARLESEMRAAAKRFEFEKAAELRDRIKYLRGRELQLA
jgi:excinuclease ABC subunit B